MRLCLNMLIFTHNLGNWLIVVYHIGFCERHTNCPQWDLILGPQTPKSDTLPLDHCNTLNRMNCGPEFELVRHMMGLIRITRAVGTPSTLSHSTPIDHKTNVLYSNSPSSLTAPDNSVIFALKIILVSVIIAIYLLSDRS